MHTVKIKSIVESIPFEVEVRQGHWLSLLFSIILNELVQ